jgi:hypothetical protein
MAQRTSSSQSIHDNVIESAARQIANQGKLKVYSNPGSLKNAGINGLYPDLILTPLGSNSVSFVIEIETTDSVTMNESSQWKEYLALGGIFYLLVPAESLQAAKTICIRQSIAAKFGTYSIAANGSISIHYE